MSPHRGTDQWSHCHQPRQRPHCGKEIHGTINLSVSLHLPCFSNYCLLFYSPRCMYATRRASLQCKAAWCRCSVVHRRFLYNGLSPEAERPIAHRAGRAPASMHQMIGQVFGERLELTMGGLSCAVLRTALYFFRFFAVSVVGMPVVRVCRIPLHRGLRREHKLHNGWG